MSVLRFAAAVGIVAASMAVAAPASAQFFLRAKDLSAAPVTGTETGLGMTLPGATPAEQRAALVWSMRAALNVAALQCQFEPTLLTVDHYNAVLKDHGTELKTSFDTIGKYFARTAKTKAAGQTALDQFGTRTYSGYATVAAQLGFCTTANSIGRDAIFTPRGKFGDITLLRMRELRNSLVPYGEQHFSRYIGRDYASFPRLDPMCWNGKGMWVAKKCGAFTLGSNAGPAVAAR